MYGDERIRKVGRRSRSMVCQVKQMGLSQVQIFPNFLRHFVNQFWNLRHQNGTKLLSKSYNECARIKMSLELRISGLRCLNPCNFTYSSKSSLKKFREFPMEKSFSPSLAVTLTFEKTVKVWKALSMCSNIDQQIKLHPNRSRFMFAKNLIPLHKFSWSKLS